MREVITIMFAGLLALSLFAQQPPPKPAPDCGELPTMDLAAGVTGDPGKNSNEVVALLREFLSKVDDPAMHDRFWADTLTYTSGKGVARTKADIMQGMNAPKPANPPAAPKITYTAEDIHVRDHGAVVVVNFRLVQFTDGKKSAELRNTGVFMAQIDKTRVTGLHLPTRWQVIAWQATPIPPAEQPKN